MAINRIWQSGAETGSVDELPAYGGSIPTIDSVVPFTGTYRWKTAFNGTGSSYILKSVTATKQLRAGAFQINGHNSVAMCPIIHFACSANDIQIRINNNNELDLVTKGSIVDSINDFEITTWKHLSIDVKKDAISGWAKVYIDGVLTLSFSGDTGNEDIESVRIGKTESLNNTFAAHWDDIYIDDTTGEDGTAVPPILRFYYMSPNGNGNYAQWDGSDGNQIDNYLLVDEIPPETADYIETNVVDELDSFAMATLTLQTGQVIQALIPIVYGQRSETTEKVALGTRYSGTDLVGSDQDPSVGSYGFLSERQTTKPGGGSWDQTSLNGVEFVIKSRGTF